jgi:hypothetical protein
MALSQPALCKLAAIMERTGSPFEGEQLAALSRAKQLLDANGQSWAEVLHSEPPSPVVVPADRTWRQCAEQVLFDHTCTLNDWSTQFLQSILRKGFALSAKQENVLRRLAKRCGVPEWQS